MFFIRADANKSIGTGHIMRCLSIAEEFRRRGEAVTFITADNYSEEMIATKGFPVVCLHSIWNDLDRETESLVETIRTLHIEILLIDSYYVTDLYLRTIRKYTKVVYIDDVDSFIYPVDLLVNYNMYANDLDYEMRYRKAGFDTQFALGCGYAPLRTEFSNVHKTVKEKVSDILVTSGGTDNYNVAGNILDLLARQPWFEQLNYYIILGRFNLHIEDLKKKWGLHKNVHLLMNVSNISEYMKSCDIAVTAGGVTTYELCACGIPSIMYTLADNQLQIAQMASEKCFIPWIGDVRGDMENCMYNIILWLEELMADKENRERMSSKMQEIVDGNGCERLVAEIKTYHKLQKA